MAIEVEKTEMLEKVREVTSRQGRPAFLSTARTRRLPRGLGRGGAHAQGKAGTLVVQDG